MHISLQILWRIRVRVGAFELDDAVLDRMLLAISPRVPVQRYVLSSHGKFDLLGFRPSLAIISSRPAAFLVEHPLGSRPDSDVECFQQHSSTEGPG